GPDVIVSLTGAFGVGRQSPAAVSPVKLKLEGLARSSFRQVQICSATVWPQAIPLSIGVLLSGAAIIVNVTLSRASIAACCVTCKGVGVETPNVPYKWLRLVQAA